MDSLIVGFSKPRSKIAILSKLIRLVQGTEFSHVYVAWDSEWLDTRIIYEASGSMVHFIDQDRFNQKVIVVHEVSIPISKECKKKVVRFAMHKASSPYSVKQLGKIFLYKVLTSLKLPCSWLKKDDRVSYVCSELVSQILIECLGEKMDQDLDVITPADVYRNIRRIADGITNI